MLAAGTRLGPFAITSLLGVGGMGEVYRARDERLGRDVAIKVLPTVVALDPERRARFQREARVLANLNHPNIAAIHGIEEHDGFFALVLEFVEGDTLADVVARGPLSPANVIPIAQQLVDALDAAHERGIVHRDLKPANVKIRPDNTIKVLDFGLAKAVEGSGQTTDPMLSPTVTSGGTRDGVIMGTAAYMSPEQARGRPVDKRADIWAFGCVLFELLTGERPFPGESVSDVIVSVLQREPPWEALPPSLPPGVTRLLRRCLDKDVRVRLRDIGDARESLHASDVPAAVGSSPAPGRNWQLVAAAGVVGAALALAGAWLWARQSVVDAPAFDRIVRIVATSAHEFGPAISPDGKWIAYLSDARGPTDVWVKFINGGETVNLTEKLNVVVQTQDYIGGLQISPDSASLAFSGTASDAGVTSQQQSWVIPAPLGGPARPALDAFNQGLTWSPDGSHIAYLRAGGSSGDSVWVADADGGNARKILPADGGLHTHWLRWSADGRYLYFNRGWQNFNTATTEIYRVPVGGGPAEPVVRSFRRAVYPFPDAQGRGFFYSANRDSPELALWWRDLRSGRDVRVTTGIGEYGSPSVSADGTRLVATVTTTRQQIVRLDPAQQPVAPQPLSDPLSGDMDPALSADGSRVAFSSSRGGSRNIWTARSDLTNATQLTTGDSIDERPAFSPDGREIAFISDRGGRRGIWLLNAAGGAPKLLTDAPIIGGASWSRDGRRLVFSVPGAEGPTLAIVAREDGKVTPLPVSGAASFPVWSPRADVIAYLETRPDGAGVFCRTVDPNGRPVALGFPDTAIQAANGFIAWSPDAERIVSVSMPGARTGSIWMLEKTSNGSPRKLIDLGAATHVRGIAWAPDGKSLIAGFDARSGDIVLAQKAAAAK